MNQLIPLIAMLSMIVLLVVGARSLFRVGSLGDELSHLMKESRRRAIVVPVRGLHDLSRFGVLGSELSRLLQELKRHMPVYSAETVDGREAEFIRDGLPKRLPTILLVVALVVLAASVWWLSS